MTNKKTNRYALLSRSLLQEALLQLMKEKNYSKISVTDIVKQAELSRPTFYAHFETKDDLLMSYVDDLLEEIYGMILKYPLQEQVHESMPFPPNNLFKAWLKRKEIFEQVRLADIDYLILKKIRDHHYEIFSEQWPSSPLSNLNPKLIGYCINYMAGSVAMFLLHWMDEGMPYDPVIMGELLEALNSRNFSLLAGKFNDVIV
ncbi:MAG: TetR/AcrR family transcriptional regulator [Chloroflexota bacterium]